METINLDLNNLFNLSYNFEGLKILLTSIAKNQDIMMRKIRELEKNSKQYSNKLESMISGKIEIKNNLKNKEDDIAKKEEPTIHYLNIIKDDNENKIISKEKKEDISIDSKDNNFLIELENRLLVLENEYKDLKSFIPEYDKSYTLNDILDEHKVNINGINENINSIKNNINSMKENIQQMNLKIGDFSIYDIFKDTNISGDIDAAKLLVKALEKKIFEKFKFDEDKIKKDEEDIVKLKNELINLKNSSNFESRNYTYIKEQILNMSKEIEINRNHLSERILKNKDNIDKVKEKSYNNIKDINTNINNLKKEILNLEEKLNNKIDEMENNLKKEAEEEKLSSDRNSVKYEDYQNFKEGILKKCNALEKKYNSINTSIKPEVLEERINQLQKDLQNKKPNQQDFFNLSELVQSHNDYIENNKVENSNTEDSIKKMRDTISLINRKCEDLILQNLRSNRNNEDSDDNKNGKNLFLAKLDDYVETTIFNEFIKEETKLNEKFKKDIDAYKHFNDEIIETLKKAASIQDLKNLEDYIVDLFDEFKDKSYKLYPRKSDVHKNLKTLELQIKQLYEMILRKDEKADNWMLAKKPIGCFSCASCEKYLGDLKENDEKVFWNQLPEHEKDINNNRIGNGFSRILNLVNVKDNKRDKNENTLLKSEIEKSDCGKNVNKDEKNDDNDNDNTENDKNDFNATGYNPNKRRKINYRNINIEKNIKTVPDMINNTEANVGFNTQRLRLTALEGENVFKEIRKKKNDNNQALPPITFRNDDKNDIYEEGKEQKNGPKLIKIIKKKK